MNTLSALEKEPGRGIEIRRPALQNPEEERLWEEIRRYARLVPLEAEPNLGRLQEIREELEAGTYLKPEVIEETAARLVIRFMRKE